MGAIQTSYSERIGKAYAGQVADMNDALVDTKTVETSAGIGFGLAVSQGTADDGVTLGGAAFVGVTIKDVTLRVSNDDKYAHYDQANVLHYGDVWVLPSENVAPGDAVKFNSSTGVFGKTSGTTVTSAQWMSSGSTSVLARLRILA